MKQETLLKEQIVLYKVKQQVYKNCANACWSLWSVKIKEKRVYIPLSCRSWLSEVEEYIADWLVIWPTIKFIGDLDSLKSESIKDAADHHLQTIPHKELSLQHHELLGVLSVCAKR